ncbi:sensor histidine kinase [Solirubrobacter soli]|uniref:sensor histidine kinase n=1 Tax=Solirubrobacter soli TaxID=363832 RepID=UPI00056BC667|nr:sensor histidine kinase [Solirubrobacter soli]
MSGARWLLSGGLLEPGARRTVRDWVVDACIFVVAVAAGVYVLRSTWDQHSSAVVALDIVLGCVACGALWWRRERPGTVALIAIPCAAVSALAAMAPLPALFNAAIRLPLRAVFGLTALSVALSPVFALLYPDVHGRGAGWQVIVGLLLTAVALGWGLFVRAQRELVRGLRSRAEDEAREAERRRIAREMHDVLAHRLSILSVHAGAMENAPLPPEYKEAAHVIRESAHVALEELRQVIGLLRREEAVGVEPPQPTLAEIPALVEESRSAGLDVTFAGDLPDVPELVGRTAYRTVQEGLTNARKHAGDERVALTIGGGPPLVVELVSHGSASRSLPGTGTGLVGIAERIELAGGTLAFGPSPDGAFVLRATLPW